MVVIILDASDLSYLETVDRHRSRLFKARYIRSLGIIEMGGIQQIDPLKIVDAEKQHQPGYYHTQADYKLLVIFFHVNSLS